MKSLKLLLFTPLILLSSCGGGDPYLGASYTFSNYSMTYGLGMTAEQFFETINCDEFSNEAEFDAYIRQGICIGTDYKTFNFAPYQAADKYYDEDGKEIKNLYFTAYQKEGSTSKVGAAIAHIENTEIELKEIADGGNTLRDYQAYYRKTLLSPDVYYYHCDAEDGVITSNSLKLVFEFEYEINDTDVAEAKYIVNFTK